MPDACQNCGNPKPLEDVGLYEDWPYFVCVPCKPLFTRCAFARSAGEARAKREGVCQPSNS